MRKYDILILNDCFHVLPHDALVNTRQIEPEAGGYGAPAAT